jgi:hypothetical protein
VTVRNLEPAAEAGCAYERASLATFEVNLFIPRHLPKPRVEQVLRAFSVGFFLQENCTFPDR